MRRKLLVTVMMLVLVIGTLTGCGKKNVSDTGKTGGENAGTEKKEEPYHITMAYVGNEQADMEKVEAAISEITMRDLNMTVDLIQLGWGDYAEKLKLMLSGGDALDVFPIFFTNASTYINAGQIVNLNDYVGEYGKELVAEIGEDLAYGGQINGFLYGFPAMKESQSRAGLVMRKDIVDKYGIDVDSLKTYEDLTPVFEKIHAGEPNMDILVGTNLCSQIETKDPLFDGYGVLMMREGDPLKVVNWHETEEYKYRVNLMRDWYEKGYILMDAATTTESNENLIKAGNAFSYFSPVKPGYLVQADVSCGHEMVVAYVEQAEYLYSSSVNFFNWGIASNSKDPAKAMQFLNYAYTSPEFMNLINWGIEGEHYVFKNDAKTVIGFPDGVDASNSKYNLNIGWQLPNQFLGYVWEGNDENLWQQYKEFNDVATKSPAFGFIYDSSNVANELVAVANVNNQYSKALETGSADPDELLQEFIDAEYAAGLQTIIDEKQKQLDEWLATKK